MRRRTLKILFCSIALFIVLAGLSQRAVSGDTAATLEIRPVQVHGMEAGRYLSDAPIPIQLEISNRTARKIDVILDEHYRDGRPHRLWGVTVRIRDAEGNVLTQHNIGITQSDRWTFGYLHSDVEVALSALIVICRMILILSHWHRERKFKGLSSLIGFCLVLLCFTGLCRPVGTRWR